MTGECQLKGNIIGLPHSAVLSCVGEGGLIYVHCIQHSIGVAAVLLWGKGKVYSG